VRRESDLVAFDFGSGDFVSRLFVLATAREGYKATGRLHGRYQALFDSPNILSL
jgi:hypothetical protein